MVGFMDELIDQSVSDRQPAGSHGPDGTRRWTRAQAIALAVLCLAALLDTIDVTVVNVAMPAIRAALGFSEGGLAWMVNAYMVPFGGLLLLGGRAGDLLGRRRVLIAGTAVFTVASLASALAPSPAVMIVTRAAEGAAAAFAVPMTFAMLGSVFPAGPGRTRAFAVWGGVSAGAGTLGLILGGLLVSGAGWRWIFLVNVPTGALVIVSARRFLPADLPAAPLRRAGSPARRGGFDIAGALAVTGGTSLLAYAVAQTSSHSWGSARTIGLLLGAAALTGYFVVHELRVARDPLMPLSLWRNRSLTAANVVSALVSTAIFGVFYSTTLYMQQVLGYSALRTGLAYVPLGASILVAASVAPVLLQLAGVRVTSVAGSLVSLAGLVLLARVPVAGHLATDIIVPTALVGLGAGCVIVPTSVAAMSGVAAARHGVASAVMNVSRQLGGALGLSVIATVAASASARLASGGHGSPAALTGGFHAGFALSAVLLGLGIVTAAALLREDGRGTRVNLIELQAGA
jgi:EmrB/QacA subfamily drug resistance transporter